MSIRSISLLEIQSHKSISILQLLINSPEANNISLINGSIKIVGSSWRHTKSLIKVNRKRVFLSLTKIVKES